mgnify:CR=1 FL=1
MYLPYHYRRLLNYLFTRVRGKVMLNDIAKKLNLSLVLVSKYIDYLHKRGFIFSSQILYVALNLGRAFIITRKRKMQVLNKSLIKSFVVPVYPVSTYFYSLYLVEPISLDNMSPEDKVILVSHSLGAKPDLETFSIPPLTERDIKTFIEKLDDPSYRLDVSFLNATFKVRFNSLDLFVLKELELNYFTTCKSIARRGNVAYHRVLKSVKKLSSVILGIRCRKTPWSNDMPLRTFTLMHPINRGSLFKLFSTLPRLPITSSIYLGSKPSDIIIGIFVLDDTSKVPSAYTLLEKLIETGFISRFEILAIYDFRGMKTYTIPYKVGEEYDKYLRKFIT